MGCLPKLTASAYQGITGSYNCIEEPWGCGLIECGSQHCMSAGTRPRRVRRGYSGSAPMLGACNIASRSEQRVRHDEAAMGELRVVQYRLAPQHHSRNSDTSGCLMQVKGLADAGTDMAASAQKNIIQL